MLSIDLISLDLTPLKLTDNGSVGLKYMEDYCVKHLPVVNKGMLEGVISEEDLLENDLDEPLKKFTHLIKPVFVRADHHMFEVIQVVAKSNLTCIPVTDDHNKYAGAITLEGLIRSFATNFSFADPGSIVVIQAQRANYSLSQITRIVEAEGGQVLSCFMTNLDEENILVTLKINLLESLYIKSTFERYGFEVRAMFSEDEYIDTLKERYDSLIHYLSI